MERKELHKHYDHIIEKCETLRGDKITEYLLDISEKLNIPSEDIIEDFIFYWEDKNNKLKTK